MSESEAAGGHVDWIDRAPRWPAARDEHAHIATSFLFLAANRTQQQTRTAHIRIRTSASVLSCSASTVAASKLCSATGIDRARANNLGKMKKSRPFCMA